MDFLLIEGGRNGISLWGGGGVTEMVRWGCDEDDDDERVLNTVCDSIMRTLKIRILISFLSIHHFLV